MERVAEAVAPLGLEPARLERLKTAVAETAMNAIEYGSQGDPTVPVDIRVDADDEAIRVRVTDRALSGPVPDAEMPDLDAKLEGKQKPRGWGLFLIRHMVDGMDVHAADGLPDRDPHPRPRRALTEGGRHERQPAGRGGRDRDPGEARLAMRGDVDIAADEALAAAYAEAAAAGRDARRPRLRATSTTSTAPASP